MDTAALLQAFSEVNASLSPAVMTRASVCNSLFSPSFLTSLPREPAARRADRRPPRILRVPFEGYEPQGEEGRDARRCAEK